jgi:hypothetical protein
MNSGVNIVIKVKSSEAFRSIAKGIDHRLCSIVLALNEKLKDVSITMAEKYVVEIDSSIYTKPEDVTESINKTYQCAVYLESTKRIRMEITDAGI